MLVKMAMAAGAARIWGPSRGLGYVGLLLRRLGARGLARSVSTWGTGEFSPRGTRGVNAVFRVWGPCRERRKGCHRRDKGRENHLERTLKGRPSTSLREEKRGSFFGGPEGGIQLGKRGGGFLISCHPPPLEGWPPGETREGDETFAHGGWRVKLP